MDLRLQARIASVIAVVGMAAILAMAYVEGEPGALPLGVLAAGVLWWLVARLREQSRLRRGGGRGP
jgi:hypothetical protein